jgi:hypothetical protein
VTDEQKALFVSIAQEGVVCGLMHPYEWLTNYQHNLMQWCEYAKVPQKEREAIDAFVQFFRECPSQPNDPIERLDAATLTGAIEAWYRRRERDDGEQGGDAR